MVLEDIANGDISRDSSRYELHCLDYLHFSWFLTLDSEYLSVVQHRTLPQISLRLSIWMIGILQHWNVEYANFLIIGSLTKLDNQDTIYQS